MALPYLLMAAMVFFLLAFVDSARAWVDEHLGVQRILLAAIAAVLHPAWLGAVLVVGALSARHGGLAVVIAGIGMAFRSAAAGPALARRRTTAAAGPGISAGPAHATRSTGAAESTREAARIEGRPRGVQQHRDLRSHECLGDG